VVADLRAVVESVAVRIVLKRIRLVVVHLRSVREPVTVRIRDGRVGPASLFRAVVESVTVGVVVEQGGSVAEFHQHRLSVAVGIDDRRSGDDSGRQRSDEKNENSE